MENLKKNIFIYWIGKKYSLINIFKELIYLHSNNGKNYLVHFLDDNNIKNYIKNIPDKYYKLRVEHKADFVRVNVICDYGGIWLDSDTLVMNNLSSLFEILKKNNGFFIKENNKHIINGVFGSKKNTKLMIKWKSIINNNLEKIPIDALHNANYWSIFGSGILNSLSKDLYNNYIIYNGLENLYPVNWMDCVREFINKDYINYINIEKNFQPLIILVNSVYRKLENINEEDLKNKMMPINYFINKSFDNYKDYNY